MENRKGYQILLNFEIVHTNFIIELIKESFTIVYLQL